MPSLRPALITMNYRKIMSKPEAGAWRLLNLSITKLIRRAQKINSLTQRDLVLVLVGIQRQTQIGRRIVRVVDLKLILESARPVIFHDRKMQMHTDRVERIA